MTDQIISATSAAPVAPGGQLTADQAQVEMAGIRSAALKDPAHPYNDRRHPEHKALHQRVLELSGIAHPQIGDDDPDDDASISTPIRRPAAIGNISAAQAKAEIDAIRAAASKDPTHPYNDRHHPEHKALHQRMLELLGIAHPGSDDEDEEGDDDSDRPSVGEPEIDAVLRQARIRGEYESTEDLAAELDLVKGFFAEAGASGQEATEVVRIFNAAAHLPEGKLHDPDRIEQAQQGCIRALKAIWGTDYDKKANAAVRAARKLDGSNGLFIAYLEETRLGDDPHIVRMLADIAQRNGW